MLFQPITLTGPATADGLPCEICDTPAAVVVVDLAAVRNGESEIMHVVLIAHSLHRFCLAHQRPPRIYDATEILNLKAVRKRPQFLGVPTA